MAPFSAPSLGRRPAHDDFRPPFLTLLLLPLPLSRLYFRSSHHFFFHPLAHFDIPSCRPSQKRFRTFLRALRHLSLPPFPGIIAALPSRFAHAPLELLRCEMFPPSFVLPPCWQRPSFFFCPVLSHSSSPRPASQISSSAPLDPPPPIVVPTFAFFFPVPHPSPAHVILVAFDLPRSSLNFRASAQQPWGRPEPFSPAPSKVVGSEAAFPFHRSPHRCPPAYVKLLFQQQRSKTSSALRPPHCEIGSLPSPPLPGCSMRFRVNYKALCVTCFGEP